MDVGPVVLDGRTVRVEPLSMEHSEGLFRVADPSLFVITVGPRGEWNRANWDTYMEKTLAMAGRIPFAIVLKESGQPVGTTSYFDIHPEHRGLEIGYTWLGKAYQGTQVNPENKYLLLRHAFETLGAIRVQLKTDKRNLHSQRAMAKLGAKFEGILRKHSILDDGYVRDTAMFSITDDEWPEVKAALVVRLGYVP
ncbi:MAG: GNAT family protein [Chloroflexota bacterium]